MESPRSIETAEPVGWRYFTRDEFDCACGECENEIDHEFVSKLDQLRHILGFPMRVNSGYRCPEHNAKVSSTGLTGPHTTGKAADISVQFGPAYHLVNNALGLGFTGIGVKQHGPTAGRFIHLDMLPTEGNARPRIWSY